MQGNFGFPYRTTMTSLNDMEGSVSDNERGHNAGGMQKGSSVSGISEYETSADGSDLPDITSCKDKNLMKKICHIVRLKQKRSKMLPAALHELKKRIWKLQTSCKIVKYYMGQNAKHI